MSRDVELFDAEGETYGNYDDIVTLAYWEGSVPGVEAAVSWLNSQAVERFKSGDDKEAIELRALAKKMHDELAALFQGQVDEFRRNHPELD